MAAVELAHKLTIHNGSLSPPLSLSGLIQSVLINQP